MASNNIDIKTFGNISVLDEKGIQRQLSDFWKDRCAAFLFIRHFG